MENDDIVAWLKERGHTEEEISQVLQRIEQYENQTLHDSVMDSIGAGTLDLETFIADALRDSKPDDQKK